VTEKSQDGTDKEESDGSSRGVSKRAAPDRGRSNHSSSSGFLRRAWDPDGAKREILQEEAEGDLTRGKDPSLAQEEGDDTSSEEREALNAEQV
jgi:hypothetical protein